MKLLLIDDCGPSPWPEHLKPIGEDTFEKEPFCEWWDRQQRQLAHLHPKICEQWIYRHWLHSPFSFLNLEQLDWSETELETAELLAAIHREFAVTLNPVYDFDKFQGRNGQKSRTAEALDKGTWDYPIIVLKTPEGIRRRESEMPDVRCVLVEGHQRHRYLNALHVRGVQNGPHKVFILHVRGG